MHSSNKRSSTGYRGYLEYQKRTEQDGRNKTSGWAVRVWGIGGIEQAKAKQWYQSMCAWAGHQRRHRAARSRAVGAELINADIIKDIRRKSKRIRQASVSYRGVLSMVVLCTSTRFMLRRSQPAQRLLIREQWARLASRRLAQRRRWSRGRQQPQW